eukprot:UN05267
MACDMMDTCLGYSFYEMTGVNRCALWVDQEEGDIVAPSDDWGVWPAINNWSVGVDMIDQASGEAGWSCYIKMEPTTTQAIPETTSMRPVTTLVGSCDGLVPEQAARACLSDRIDYLEYETMDLEQELDGFSRHT